MSLGYTVQDRTQVVWEKPRCTVHITGWGRRRFCGCGVARLLRPGSFLKVERRSHDTGSGRVGCWLVDNGQTLSSLGSRSPCCLFLFGIVKRSSVFLAGRYCFKGPSHKMLRSRHCLSRLLSTIWRGSCRRGSGELWNDFSCS